MNLIDKTLHKILYTKHTRSGGKIIKQPWDVGMINTKWNNLSDNTKEKVIKLHNKAKKENISAQIFVGKSGGKIMRKHIKGRCDNCGDSSVYGKYGSEYLCYQCRKGRVLKEARRDV